MLVRGLCLRGQSLSLVKSVRYDFRGHNWRGTFVVIKSWAVKTLNWNSTNCVTYFQIIIIIRTYVIQLAGLYWGIIFIVTLELFLHLINPLRVFEWLQISFELTQFSNSFFCSGDDSNDFSVILISLYQFLEILKPLWYDYNRFIGW